MEYLFIVVPKNANKTKKKKKTKTKNGTTETTEMEKKHIFLWDLYIEI